MAQRNMVGGAIGYTNDSAGKYSLYLKCFYPCYTTSDVDSLQVVAHTAFSSPGIDSFFVHKIDEGQYSHTYASDTFTCGGANKHLYRYVTYRASIDLDGAVYTSYNKFWFKYSTIPAVDSFYRASNCGYQEILLYAYLDRSLGENSNVGGLNNLPLFTALLNNELSFAFGAIDTFDHDSLSYSVQRSGGTGLSCFRFFNAAPPLGFRFDAETGEMIFTPDSAEDKVSWEYFVNDLRYDTSGTVVKIGSTNTQVITHIFEDTTNISPTIKGPYLYSVCAGDLIGFNIETNDLTASGAGGGDTLSLEWNGAIPGASFGLTDSSARIKTGRFSWTPDETYAHSYPYYFRVQVRDHHDPLNAYNSKMFGVKVKPHTSPVLTVDSIGCNRYVVTVSDTSTINPQYAIEVLDSNGLTAFNVQFSKSGVHRSIFPEDTLHIRGNGRFIIRAETNNTFNCPSRVYDTITIDSSFNIRVTQKHDVICPTLDSMFLEIDSMGHDRFHISWDYSINDSQLYYPLRHHAMTTGIVDLNLVVKDDRGCNIEYKDQIYVFGFQKLDTSNFLHLICENDGHLIRTTLDSASRPFRWNTGDSTMSIKVLDGGQYRIHTRTDSGCYFSDSVVLDPAPMPTISISSQDSICSNDSIIAQIRAGGVIQNIKWNTGSLKMYTLPNFGTTYWVNVTATSKCVFSDTVTGIHQYPPLSTGYFTDTSVSCDGDTIELNALQSGVKNVQVKWSTGDTTPLIRVVSPGIYSYEAHDANCYATDTTRLVHVASPNATLPDTIEVCPDYPTLVQAPPNPSFKTVYFWNGKRGGPKFTVDTASMVYLRISRSGVCEDMDSAIVLHHPKIALGMLQRADTVCIGDTLQLDPSILVTPYSVLWNTGNSNAVQDVLTDGVFSVRVEDLNGCVFADTIQIESFAKPQNVDLGEDRVICSYSNLVLNVAPEHNGKVFLWPDSSTGTKLTVDQSGTYWVRVTNDKGCSASDTIHVVKKEPLPSLPIQSADLCFGDTIHLKLSTADSVRWSLPDSTVVDSNFVILSYLDEGRTDYLVVDTSMGIKCQLKGSVTIYYERNNQIFGKVLNNDLVPIINGKVELVQIRNDKAVILGELITDNNGDYSFEIGCPDSVVVRGATNAKQFKGYSLKGVDINRARMAHIGPGDVEVRQIIMNDRPAPGPGKVAGIIRDSLTNETVDGMEVFLVDAISRNPVAIDSTVDGAFVFENVPYGNYAVFTDRWKFINQTDDRIPVNQFTPSYDTLEFIISDIYLHLLNTLSVDELKENRILVYPNPASDIVYLESDAPYSEVVIFSQDGRLVHSDQNVSGTHELSAEGWQSGVYIVRLTTINNKYYYVRLMVLRE